MFCTRCGAANPDELMYCTSCSAPLVKPGEALRGQGSAGSVQNPDPDAPQPGQSQPNQSDQPYPGYQSSYSGVQQYQPYQSSYSNQLPVQSGSASGRAIASMILSVISPFTCGFVLSIPGMIMGKMEMNAIRDGQAPKAGETMAKVGFYVGLIVTALSCLLGLVWAVIMMIGATANSVR